MGRARETVREEILDDAAARLRRFRTALEDFARRGPLAVPASVPGGLVLRAERWLRYR